MDKRPVWIFKGNSGLGKSYLAGIIANSNRVKAVYETDAHKELDTIVVGNKYKHSLEEIESKIKGEHEIIYVDFVREWVVKMFLQKSKDMINQLLSKIEIFRRKSIHLKVFLIVCLKNQVGTTIAKSQIGANL